MSKPDGGPAFPKQPVMHMPHGVTMVSEQGGMSLHDYLAAHAPDYLRELSPSDCAALVGRARPSGRPVEELIAWHAELEAKLRWAYADAMLAARDKP